MKWKTTMVAGTMLVGLTTLGTGTAYAAPEYCSAGADPLVTESQTPQLSTGDVTFRTVASDDCYGIGDGNLSNLAAVNAEGLWGGGWEALVRDEGAPGTQSYLGLDWTLSAPNNVSSGAWTLSIADPPPSSLPVTVDLLVILKGGSSWAAYLFTAEVFSVVGSNAGTFAIQFLNNGDNLPDLSHMDVVLRGATTTVPEPGSLLLLGMGLVAAASGRRLHRRRLMA